MFYNVFTTGDIWKLKEWFPNGGIALNKGKKVCFWNLTGPNCIMPKGYIEDLLAIPKGVTMRNYPDPKDKYANLDGMTIMADPKIGRVQVSMYRARQFSNEWVVIAYPYQFSHEKLLEFVGTVDTLEDLLAKFFDKNHHIFSMLP